VPSSRRGRQRTNRAHSKGVAGQYSLDGSRALGLSGGRPTRIAERAGATSSSRSRSTASRKASSAGATPRKGEGAYGRISNGVLFAHACKKVQPHPRSVTPRLPQADIALRGRSRSRWAACTALPVLPPSPRSLFRRRGARSREVSRSRWSARHSARTPRARDFAAPPTWAREALRPRFQRPHVGRGGAVGGLTRDLPFVRVRASLHIRHGTGPHGLPATVACCRHIEPRGPRFGPQRAGVDEEGHRSMPTRSHALTRKEHGVLRRCQGS
jgi:hypothetical protein